jgi:hypothetical protein
MTPLAMHAASPHHFFTHCRDRVKGRVKSRSEKDDMEADAAEEEEEKMTLEREVGMDARVSRV